MQIEYITGRVPVKSVFVTEVNGERDEDIANFAMQAAGESPMSLHGWRVSRDFHEPDVATVSLHTD